MNRNLRKTVIAGNWKMNLAPSGARKLIEELKPLVAGMDGCEIVVCVPFIDVPSVAEAVKGTNIKVGAQNVHFMKSGAYTGEISAGMLVEAGAEYVIVGHSERRQYFGETDETVNLRLTAALEAGLKPILCVGELLEQRDRGITAEIVSMQTKIAFQGIDAENVKNVIVAYEPVWAIGTGRTATSEQADEVCGIIRGVIADKYGAETAEAVTSQYGGSMNPGNAAELLEKYNVDGGLIGGASLKATDFAAIIDAAQK
jgi:triosephosphate isomerase